MLCKLGGKISITVFKNLQYRIGLMDCRDCCIKVRCQSPPNHTLHRTMAVLALGEMCCCWLCGTAASIATSNGPFWRKIIRLIYSECYGDLGFWIFQKSAKISVRKRCLKNLLLFHLDCVYRWIIFWYICEKEYSQHKH